MSMNISKILLAPKILLALIGALLLNACNAPVDAPNLSAPSFTDKPSFAFDVAEIGFVNEYKPDTNAYHVEKSFPTPPEKAIENWAHDRLYAAGKDRLMQVVITEASVIGQSLPKKGGLTGSFTKQPSERYTANIGVELRIYGKNSGLSEASVRGKTQVMRELQEGATPREREALFAEMTRDLMNNLNKTLEDNIQRYFSRYLLAN